MSEATQTPEIDLEAFAKKVAEETAAKISMKQAEQKAAEKAEAEKTAEAEAAKTAQAEQVQASIKSGIETGAEKLLADVKAEFEAEKAETQEILNKYKKDLEEKSAEIEAIQNSKKTFAGRTSETDLTSFGKQFLQAKVLGAITKKGWDTNYHKDFLEKNVGVAGPGVGAIGGVNLDAIVETQFEKELQLELKVANFIKEIQVASKVTLLPIIPESVAATFNTGSPATAAAGNTVNNLGGNASGTAQVSGSDPLFNAVQKRLLVERLTSTTYLDNDTEESTLVALLPMIQEAMVRAHARAIDSMIINGNALGANRGGNSGLVDFATTTATDVTGKRITTESPANTLGGTDILQARSAMGKYGLNPADLALAVSIDAYNDLLFDTGFQDITEVGSDLAIKVTGQIGTIFAIPVVISDSLAGKGSDGAIAGVLFNRNNYVIPRFRGVTIESETQVANQRTAVVASQSLGFDEMVDDFANNLSAVKFAYNA